MRHFITHQLQHHYCSNILIFLLFYTALPITSLAQPQIAQLPEVATCQYLSQIEGTSGYGKHVSWQVLAKSMVLNKAEKMAATHIVWTHFDSVGGFNGVAIAKAYQCKNS